MVVDGCWVVVGVGGGGVILCGYKSSFGIPFLHFQPFVSKSMQIQVVVFFFSKNGLSIPKFFRRTSIGHPSAVVFVEDSVPFYHRRSFVDDLRLEREVPLKSMERWLSGTKNTKKNMGRTVYFPT